MEPGIVDTGGKRFVWAVGGVGKKLSEQHDRAAVASFGELDGDGERIAKPLLGRFVFVGFPPSEASLLAVETLSDPAIEETEPAIQ